MIALSILIANMICGLLGILFGCIFGWLVVIPAMNYPHLGFWWIPFINDDRIGKVK